jgi:hypothetical protein
MNLRLWTCRQWLILLIATMVSVPTIAGAQASPVHAVTPPENPTFTVETGSSSTQLRVLFTPTSGIVKYTIRVYTTYDNYDQVALEESDYSSGQQIGNGSRPGNCNGDALCAHMGASRGMKFTIQGYDSSNLPITNESPKSIPYFPTPSLSPQVSQTNLSASPALRFIFSLKTGQTSMSVRIYQSSDNYQEVFREVNNVSTSGSYDVPTSGTYVELPAGFTYKYAYRAIGSTLSTVSYLSSAWKLSTESILLYTRPNPPTNVQLAGGDKSVIASWADPQVVADAEIISYLFQISSDKIDWWQYGADSTSRSRTISGLTNGTPYWVRMRAFRSFGIYSEWVSQTTVIPSYIPSPPSLSVVAGDKRIDATWLAPTLDGGAPITNYLIQYTSDGSTWTDITVNSTKRTHTITGLVNGTEYTVRIYARNNTGLSDTNSFPRFATPVGSAVPQTSPVVKIDTTRATVGMTVDSQGNVLTPYIEVGTPSGFENTYYGTQANGANLQLSKDLTGLTPGFIYRVRSGVVINDIPAYGTEFTLSTTPNPPANLAATTTGTTSSVSWSASPTNNGNYIKYQIWAEQNGVEAGNRCTTFIFSTSCQITGLTPGKFYVIKATARATTANYGNGTSLAATLNVATLAPQEITFSFSTLPRKGYQSRGTEFDISGYGSSNSGLPVTFTSQTIGKCSVIGTTVFIVNPGTCNVRATQAGNSKFATATPVDASFVIANEQTVSFSITSVGTQTFGDAPLDLESLATASSGLNVSFSSTTTSICTVIDTSVTYIGAGKCRIVASQIGDVDYDPAANVAREFTVNQGAQSTVTINSTTGTYGTELLLTTTGGSGSGVVSFAIDTDSVLDTAIGCSVSSNGLMALSAGKCAVIATKSDDVNYLTKESVSTLVTLQKASQTISFTPIAGGTLLQGGSVTASVRSSSGLSVTITSATESKCTVSGTTVSLVADGICTIHGTQSGNSNYDAATAVTTSFEISPKPIPSTNPIEYIRLTAPASYKVGDVVQLSVLAPTHGGSVVHGTYEFISTSPEGFFFGDPTVDEGGNTHATVTFTRANMAFNLYAVFTPTDRVNFAQGQTFAAIRVDPKPQTIVVDGDMDQFGRTMPISFSGIESTGQMVIDLSPMTSQGGPANIQDQRDHCTISNQTVTRDDSGYCYVRVSVMGDGIFESSLGVGTFYFSKLPQSIVIMNSDRLNSLTAENIGDTVDLSEMAIASSALTVTVTSTSPSVCTVEILVVTIVNSGVCELEVTQSGDDTYQAATEYAYAFTVIRLDQGAITLTSTSTVYGTPLTLTATGGSGTGQFTFTTENGLATGCTVINETLVSTSSGSCLVTVVREGDNSYFSKATQPMFVEITRASQAIEFASVNQGSIDLGAPPVDLTAFVSATSGSLVEIRSNDSRICEVTGSIVTVFELGTCALTASQEGTENYEPATDVVQSFSVVVKSTPEESQVSSGASPGTPASSGVSPGTQTPAPISPALRAQSAPRTPSKAKLRSTLKFTMKAPSGLPLGVSASGACKSAKITKIVSKRVKVGKKFVVKKSVVQTGWSLKFTKRGTCRTTFKNNGSGTYLPLKITKPITVK